MNHNDHSYDDTYYADCDGCREERTASVLSDVEFWDLPLWDEDEIRAAMNAVMHTIGDQAKVEAVINKLKEESA